MADLPYVINTKTLAKIFNTMQSTGVPVKFNVKYLASLGLTSSNERYLPPFLKDLGFVGSDGTPTGVWKEYRDTARAPFVMAEAVRKAYSGLFSLYPDAPSRDDEAVRNWMRSHSPTSSGTTVDRSLATFRAIITLANFGDGASNGGGSKETANSGAPSDAVEKAVDVTPTRLMQPPNHQEPQVVINIQLQIPATDDPKVYDKFFEARRKHVLGPPSSNA